MSGSKSDIPPTATNAQGNTSVDDMAVRVANVIADTTHPVATLTSTRTLKEGAVSYKINTKAAARRHGRPGE